MKTNNTFQLRTPIIHLYKKEIEDLPASLKNVIKKQYLFENNPGQIHSPQYNEVIFERIGFSKSISM